ncbi:rhomboid family intramembrane serine protease [Mucilaginibacter sp. UYCu711]|uniref:rhomboid family intramembrane serine protease n=1 Tax=Mucilaginibacter sp. UYCu711 TaxID=3156339 RepID=UPI003D214DAC
MSVIFIGMSITTFSKKLHLKFILHPVSIFRHSEYYRLFTSDLVHNDIGHFLLNEVMAFYVCGDLERNLRSRSAHGSLLLLIIYLVSFASGIIYTTFRHRRDFDYSSAGASGSIIGCMMSFMILAPSYIALYLPLIGGIKNIYASLIVLIGLIIYKVRSGNELMDHERHFFSALGGILITLVLFPGVFIKKRPREISRDQKGTYHQARQEGPVAAITAPTAEPTPPKRPPMVAETTMLYPQSAAPAFSSPASSTDKYFMVW